MISFRFADPVRVHEVCARLPESLAPRAELLEMEAQCRQFAAWCLECEDGVVVVDLRPSPDGAALELFVQLAVATRHGAFARQDAALRDIARDLGAKTIAFNSRRRGWARRLGPQWTPRGDSEFVRAI